MRSTNDSSRSNRQLSAHGGRISILADALDAQSKTLAAIADALRSGADEVRESKYVDQYSSPLSRRVYLAHARCGAFATKRVGKRVIAERDVFARWLDEQADSRRVPAPPKSGARSVDDTVLAELGARKAGAR